MKIKQSTPLKSDHKSNIFFSMKLVLHSLGLVSLCLYSTAYASPLVNAADDGNRYINHISWDKKGGNYKVDDTQLLPNNQSRIVFMRPSDSDPLETSANIGIDGDFHVSLQPGYYSQTTVCSGVRSISVVPTGFKNNILSSNDATSINLNPQQTYYYYVEVDDKTGATKLTHITADSATEILAIKSEQTHQTSRVTTECPEVDDVPVVIAPPVRVEPPPPVQIIPEQPVVLDVLFKFDSAEIQPIYNERIQAVADYMNRYPTTVTRLEGHTDSTGPASYNMKLSQRRANSVAQELANRYGANPARLTTEGYGEARPIAPNTTKAGRQQNRRVVAIVSEQ